MESVETWIDALAARWEISDGRSGTVRSFRIFSTNDYPASMAGLAPCVVSYPTDLEVEYSQGGPTILLWSGQSDFHLTLDVKPSNIPYILPFYGRILTAAAGSMKLGGLVSYFTLPQNQKGAMTFVTYKNALGQDDHQGIIVQWIVKQVLSGQLTVSQ